jgi:hypothetical protein
MDEVSPNIVPVLAAIAAIIFVVLPDAWLRKFSLCDLVTGDGVGIRDPDLAFLARRMPQEVRRMQSS